jgi:hypothetical protein
MSREDDEGKRPLTVAAGSMSVAEQPFLKVDLFVSVVEPVSEHGLFLEPLLARTLPLVDHHAYVQGHRFKTG